MTRQDKLLTNQCWQDRLHRGLRRLTWQKKTIALGEPGEFTRQKQPIALVEPGELPMTIPNRVNNNTRPSSDKIRHVPWQTKTIPRQKETIPWQKKTIWSFHDTNKPFNDKKKPSPFYLSSYLLTISWTLTYPVWIRACKSREVKPEMA